MFDLFLCIRPKIISIVSFQNFPQGWPLSLQNHMYSMNQQMGSSQIELCPENLSHICSHCLELQVPNSVICFVFSPYLCTDCNIYLFLKSDGKLADSPTPGYWEMWCRPSRVGPKGDGGGWCPPGSRAAATSLCSNL